MSRDETFPGKRVALFSAKSYLHTGLLAKLIEEQLQLTCAVFSDPQNIPEDTDLVLIDCSGESQDFLAEVAQKMHSVIDKTPAAIINVEYDGEQEKLLEWPFISGIFYCDSDQEQLIRGLVSLLKGDYWVPRRLLHQYLHKNRKAPSSALNHTDVNLTKRERQILRLIKDGATNAGISEDLNVSEHTVKSHLYNVYKKIGVRNRLEASNWVRDLDDI